MMFKVELLNQIQNIDHFYSPILVSNVSTTFNNCEESNDTITCSTDLVSFQNLFSKCDQYMTNNTIYLRLSHGEDLEIVNYVLWFISRLSRTAFDLRTQLMQAAWFILVMALMSEHFEVFFQSQRSISKFENFLRFLSFVIFISVMDYILHCMRCKV